jgi:hypothetical protein
VLAGDRGERPVVKRHFMMFVVSTIAVCGLIVLMLPPTLLTSRGRAHLEPPSFYGIGGDGACVFDGRRAVPGTSRRGADYQLLRDLWCTRVEIHDGVRVYYRDDARGVVYGLYASQSLDIGGETSP